MPIRPETAYDDNGGGGVATPKQYTATFNITYYAKYSDVSNVSNGTSVSRSTSTTGTPGYITLYQNVTSTIPVRTGYNFAGWRVDDDDSKALYQPGQEISASVQYGTNYYLGLYTRWSIKTYAIRYYGNGGSNTPSAQSKNYGAAVTLSTSIPTRDNYIFVSWNTRSDGTGVSYAAGQSYSGNDDLSLYAIWRPASSIPTLNKTSVAIGSTVVISTNRTDPDAVHTLKYSFEESSGTIATNVTTSYTWTIPSSFYALLPSKTSAVCTISCETYNSGVKIGDTQTVTVTVTVPETIRPTITVNSSVVNDGDLSTIISNAVVQGYSKVSFTLSSTPGIGSSFAAFSITGPDLPSNLDPTASTVVTNTISGSGTLIWVIYAIDQRGRTSDAISVQVNAVAYSRPSISPISMHRCDQNGNEDASYGTYLTTRAFYSATNIGTNAVTSAKVYYRRSGLESSSWTLGIDLTSQTNAGSGLWTSPFGSGNIAIEYSYEVKYEIQDSIGAATNQQAITIISYPMPSGAGVSMGIFNDRVRLGGLVEEPGFVVDWASKFKNVVMIQNINSFGIECTIAGEGDNISLLLTGNK